MSSHYSTIGQRFALVYYGVVHGIERWHGKEYERWNNIPHLTQTEINGRGHDVELVVARDKMRITDRRT